MGGRGARWRRFFCECLRGIILVRNLLRQAEDQYRIPVRLPFPQGTGKASSVYHAIEIPRNRDIDTAIEPSTYV